MAPATTIIATFNNDEAGIATIVAAIDNGRYSVVLKDIDSGEIFPSIKIYPTLDAAMVSAADISGRS